MSDPSWAPARRLAGNYDDDDGQVLGSFMTTDPTPPEAFPAAATPIPAPSPEPKRPTRFISGTFIMDPTNAAPALIVPQDVERESLSVRVISDNPTDYILLGEEANRVASENLAHRLQSGQGGAAQGFDAHTGAVWAALPTQPNYAATLDPSVVGNFQAVNGNLDTVPAPWDPTRQAIRLTSTATGGFAIRSVLPLPAFMRSGQTVVARAKVQSNLFSAITLAVSTPGTSTNLASANATGVANTQAGWRELILTGTLQRDASGNLAFYVSGTSAAIGDTIIAGDFVLLDRPYQGRTVISWAVVTK